jgi:hypothetical protein
MQLPLDTHGGHDEYFVSRQELSNIKFFTMMLLFAAEGRLRSIIRRSDNVMPVSSKL